MIDGLSQIDIRLYGEAFRRVLKDLARLEAITGKELSLVKL